MFRPFVLTSWLLLGAAAVAQGPALPVPGLPSASSSSGATLPNGLEFPNADVKAVLSQYETLTGKRLVLDSSVQGPVNIVVRTPLTKDEAVRIIEMSLLLNGYSLIPAGGDVVKVLGLGNNPRGFGIPIISDDMQLPENEQVVTFVYKLRYADPTEVQQILSQYIVPSKTGYNQLLALPKSSSLLITENTTIIRGLLKVIREIDVEPIKVETEFIELKRADAKTVTENILKIINPQQAAAAGAGPGGAVRPVAAGGPRPAPRVTPEGTPIPNEVTATVNTNGSIEINTTTALTEDAVIKAVLTPDERTNRIHVVARPANMPFLRQLILDFDKDVPFGIPATRPLRFRPADEILPVIVKAISDPGAKTDEAGGTATPGGGSPNRQTGLGSGRSTGGGGGGDFGSNGGLGGSGGSGSINSNVNDSLETQPRETKPIAVTLGSTKLIADNATNSIIVIGNTEVKQKVFKLIAELDVRPPQVMLHTIIGELTLSDSEQFGVDYILRKGGQIGGVNTGLGSGTGTGTGTGNGTGITPAGVVGFSGPTPQLNFNALLNQKTITQLAAAGAGGLSGFFTAGNTMDAIVTALESTRRFRVTQRPSIFAQNNQVASIISGQEIAIPGNIQSSLNSFNQSSGIVTNSTVQYKTVALKLEILPLINSEREVSLDVVQRVDEVSGSTRIDQNDIPTVSTRAVKTHVSVPNQGTLVLGGLIRQAQTNTKTGIPVLSRIPVIGGLFRSTTKDKARTELVIMIRPEVTMTPCESVDAKERQMEYLNIDPDLETTLVPPNMRKRGAADELLRRSQLTLRQEAVCEDDKSIKVISK